jgi:uncharacterized protein (TIGR03790 family)
MWAATIVFCVYLLVLPSLAIAAVATDVVVQNGDEQVTVSWKLPPDGAGIAVYRLYQRRQGTELAFNVKPEFLVKDLLLDTSLTVKGLVNGEQYLFSIKAYNVAGKELGTVTATGYPGSDPGEQPAMPKDIYGAEGDNRISLFWGKNTQRNILGWEIFRRCTTDTSYKRYARVPRIAHFKSGKNSEVSHSFIAPGYFRDDKATNNDICMYRVRTVASSGKSSELTQPVGLRATPYSPPTPDEVLVLYNKNRDGSEELARYYAEKRGIPSVHIFGISAARRFNYRDDLQKPLIQFLLKNNLAGRIKYIVPCYGVPVAADGRALDSKLADLFDRYTWGSGGLGTPNPYFGQQRHFDGTYGIYIVTRLDGPTPEIARSLIDKAITAEKKVTAQSGRAMFVHDENGKRLEKAGKRLGVQVVLKPDSFSAKELLPDDVYWYFAWRHMYRNIRGSVWPDGAVAAHLISYSFMGGFRAPQSADRNWVQGLLEDGITATFGAVIEPYKQGYTREDLFFERFWTGDYSFGEAFMAATPTIQWAMSAVGDPLYRLGKVKQQIKRNNITQNED